MFTGPKMLVQYLFLPLLTFFLQVAYAQPIACAHSCPSVDKLGQFLLKRVLAIPYESDYSVFECVYGEVNANPKTHSCFYTKGGRQALGSPTNQCPQEAIPCSDNPNSFSSLGHPEVPPWIEAGRWLLYLKENHT